ncbi:metallophosphoesterase family protein [Providencia rettgeri]
MKIAAISDIHGNLSALQAVLADIENESVDLVVNLGDILSGPLYPFETAKLLMQRDYPTIKGNHERQLLSGDNLGESDSYVLSVISNEQKYWLNQLPNEILINEDIYLTHGTPENDLTYMLETVTKQGITPTAENTVKHYLRSINASLILCGHTHLPNLLHLDNGQLVVNPGSVGLQAYDDTHPFYHKMESGSPHARYAVIEGKHFDWKVNFKKITYDWNSAAQQAGNNNRNDWVIPLKTGRVG